ncbi:MAG: CatB-related O-acetyltransferase [Ilumatobacteraceae bacterium]|nr:CatB-related O-acetyltransferase [Ilumatobacteraceae bacterium]
MVAFSAIDGPPPYLVVGNYCSIADGVTVMVNGGHRTDWTTTFPIREIYQLPGRVLDGHPKASGPVTIGSDVWIGAGATLLGGIVIGHGAVVGADAVVASDVRPYSIVVGNPAREIRRRFDDESVGRLLALEWWALGEADVMSLVDVLCAVPDLDELERRVHEVRGSA